MARKNPFEKVMDQPLVEVALPGSDYAAKGASRSIMNTIDELADKADKLLEGETIVELDPNIIDPSFIKDRLYEDDEFAALMKAIQDEGQSSPILVRPHPEVAGRYMVVFGARRRKVALELGTKVRAVVKNLDARGHAIAQGQENAARANLSFIERAMLASALVRQRYDDDNATVLSALAIDKATLSKMLSVSKIPTDIFDAIGAAKAIGRDRWYELKTLLDNPANLQAAHSLVLEHAFLELIPEERFERLVGSLRNKKKLPKRKTLKSNKWVPEDNGLCVDLSAQGKNFTLAVKAKGDKGIQFGEYISENLASLYEAFKRNSKF